MPSWAQLLFIRWMWGSTVSLFLCIQSFGNRRLVFMPSSSTHTIFGVLDVHVFWLDEMQNATIQDSDNSVIICICQHKTHTKSRWNTKAIGQKTHCGTVLHPHELLKCWKDQGHLSVFLHYIIFWVLTVNLNSTLIKQKCSLVQV